MNGNTASGFQAFTTSKQTDVQSLIEETRNSLLGILKTEQKENNANKYRVLVLDQRATRVLGACLRMYNVTEHNIALVESLTKKRKRFPDMYVSFIFAFIYLLTIF